MGKIKCLCLCSIMRVTGIEHSLPLIHAYDYSWPNICARSCRCKSSASKHGEMPLVKWFVTEKWITFTKCK